MISDALGRDLGGMFSALEANGCVIEVERDIRYRTYRAAARFNSADGTSGTVIAQNALPRGLIERSARPSDLMDELLAALWQEMAGHPNLRMGFVAVLLRAIFGIEARVRAIVRGRYEIAVQKGQWRGVVHAEEVDGDDIMAILSEISARTLGFGGASEAMQALREENSKLKDELKAARAEIAALRGDTDKRVRVKRRTGHG